MIEINWWIIKDLLKRYIENAEVHPCPYSVLNVMSQKAWVQTWQDDIQIRMISNHHCIKRSQVFRISRMCKYPNSSVVFAGRIPLCLPILYLCFPVVFDDHAPTNLSMQFRFAAQWSILMIAQENKHLNKRGYPMALVFASIMA